jgi:4-hydroxyphenylpyruvate dioxygenase
MPGQGDLPVVAFMRAVAATGYAGPLSLEIFNDQFRGGSPKAVAVDGRRSLVNLMDQVRRSEPGLAPAVPPMPDRVRVEGVEFVEFAASEQEAADLGHLLTTMGFAPKARHRNKDVVLWRQGSPDAGINIVVNTEHEGFAHSSYVVHGTNAYALALRVEDAEATVARARALGAETFEQKRRPGELAIPAIRGMGGGVIYFVDNKLARVWDIEFEPLPLGRTAGEAGLVVIDHVAQTMNYEEMLTWILFYTSIFRTRKLPMVDVADPGGLVRSQVIESDDGTLRLTLNGAQSRKTLAGHFIAESFGSSIQHLAFRTGDIFATADTMRERGFRALEISPNYYDDLEARFSLEASLTDRLRAGHILYDRDEAGEYFQFYSTNYGEGFFFEVVERRCGYRGYGAANAPFRIAAQKRQLRPPGMPKI